MAKQIVNFTGTVSEGTMRPEDLIPAFMEVLQQFWPERAEGITEEYSNDANFDYDSEDADWMLNESLFDALNEIAPEGCYFGSHPGDGVDYGFWTDEEDYYLDSNIDD
jgi:hypothetical protein